jgi:hypothetical protein
MFLLFDFKEVYDLKKFTTSTAHRTAKIVKKYENVRAIDVLSLVISLHMSVLQVSQLNTAAALLSMSQMLSLAHFRTIELPTRLQNSMNLFD